MLKLVDENELMTIDMGDGDWVKIPARLSFGFVSEFQGVTGENVEKTATFLLKLLKEWSIKDENGLMLPITKENVLKLDIPSLVAITAAIKPLTTVEKKTELPS